MNNKLFISINKQNSLVYNFPLIFIYNFAQIYTDVHHNFCARASKNVTVGTDTACHDFKLHRNKPQGFCNVI